MAFLYPDAALLVFCKAPVPGQVKTRLTPFLSAEQACALHIRLTHRLLRLLDKQRLCPIQLWCSPSTEHSFFQSCAQTYNLTLHHQYGKDLGQRMHYALSSALSESEHALLTGCDCPSLTEKDFQQALQALKKDHDMVLAPADDGGYTLIGLNQACPEIFKHIEWGTSQVLETTRRQISQSNLKCYELKQQWDVDTPEDLKRLPASLYSP